jgi:hypothetical protein
MKSTRAFLAAAAAFITATIASAQPSAIQQLQNSQQLQFQTTPPELRPGTNAPELYQGENEDIGPQKILRIGNKAKAPRRQWLEGQADSQIFYSDNANFSGSDHRIGSWVFVNTAQATIAPDPFDAGAGKFAPSFGFLSQWYNYSSGRMHELDFNAQTAFANLRYLRGNWQFAVGGNFTRLLSQDDYEETYREWLPNMSIQRVLTVNDSMAFILGDAVGYHFSEVPSGSAALDTINDHLDNTLYATFNWQVTGNFVVQPFYRFQYSSYEHDTTATTRRSDYLNAVGFTAYYSLGKNATLRTFFSYTTKTSDDQFTPAYDELNGGIGATLDVRF